MDLLHLEAIAVERYERLGLDPCEPVNTCSLARMMFRSKDDRTPIVTRPPSLLGDRPGAVWWKGETPFIAVRRTVPLELVGHVVGHEAAHLLLGRKHDGDPDLEAACDYLGACLMAPRPAMLALHRAFGWELGEIADEVVATQTWAALRLGEALRVPLAAISPVAVRVRGPEEWAWPDEPELRRLSRRPKPGIKKVCITDQRARCALICDEIAG